MLNTTSKLASCFVFFFLYALSAVTYAQSDPWVDCANEGEVCSFEGTKTVRYGNGSVWVEGSYSNSVVCTNAVFGDPLKGTPKQCQYAIDAGVMSVVTCTTCANEGGQCQFDDVKAVRYGKNTT